MVDCLFDNYLSFFLFLHSRLSLARNKKTRNSGEFAPVPALTSKEVSSIAMSRSDSKRRESQTKGS